MIIGDYPCCDGELCLSMPERTPTAAPECCPHCGAKVWRYFSRIQTTSYTEKEFLEKYTVDEETKAIRGKDDE